MALLTYIYPVSFFLCLFSLILWFYFKEDDKLSSLMSRSFLGMFVVYLFSLAFSPAATSFKMLILFRDLVVLGLTSQLFNFFRNNKVVFFSLLVALMGVFRFGYLKVMQTSYMGEETAIATPITEEENVSEIPDLEANLSETGELLIEIKNGASIDAVQDILTKYKITAERAFPEMDRPDETDLDDYFSLDIPKVQLRHLAEIKAALLATGYVDWLEDNEVISTTPMEGKTKGGIKRSYGINDPGLENLWGFDKMRMDELFQLINNQGIKPKKEALIAILDTGIDAKHEDLKDNYKSVSKRYDNDPNGHGTHCAGIASAVSNNKKGIASFCPNNQFVDVTSVKVLKSFGGGTERDIIKGIIFAADKGAAVISMSLGGPSSDDRQTAYNRAISYANKAGAIVIAAAGNSNADAKNYSPANAKGIITVSAVDQRINRASFSNRVNNLKMGIAAPGVDIYSTFPKHSYRSLNGTSMATPYVAGLLGLMKSIRPDLDTKTAYDILHKSGIKTGNTAETGRFIQPAKAIELLLKSE